MNLLDKVKDVVNPVKTIEKLTDEQEALLEVYAQKWIDIGLSTDRTAAEGRNKVQDAIAIIYNEINIKRPVFEWVKSPVEAINKASPLVSGENLSPSSFMYGSSDAGWLAHYDFFLNIGVQIDPNLLILFNCFVDIAQNCFWWLPLDEKCFIVERPIAIKMEDERLHSEDSKAIEFADGVGIYSLKGFRVPEKLVMYPEQITIEEIQNERNAEIRRIMIEKFGFERYCNEANAQLLDTDEENKAELYRIELEDDEDIVFLRLEDHSPSNAKEYKIFDINGDVDRVVNTGDTFKKYVIRVDPECTTARDALAWMSVRSFGTYNPLIQT